MFNRSVEFKITKPNKSESEKPSLTSKERQERLEEFMTFAHEVAWDVAKLVGTYMVMDTWRKATIAKAAAVCCNCHK